MRRSISKTSFITPLILTLSLYLIPSSVHAQFRSSTEPAEIRGQVRYARGGAPAANVLVRLEALSGGFVGEERTDNLGKFSFTGLSPIQYFIYIHQPGFKEIQHEVNLVMTASDYVQMQLVSDSPIPSGASVYTPAKLVDANVPAEARKEFEKAETALAGAKLAEGIRHLEKATQIYPKFLEAQLQLGAAYMDLQQWDKAEQAFKQALEINQRTANAYFALGEIYARQQNYAAAERSLSDGLAIENRFYRGHFALARVYWEEASAIKNEAQMRSMLEKSYQEVSRAIELNPSLAEARLLKGNLLLRVPRAQDALAEFEAYLRLEPKGKMSEQTKAVVEKIKKALDEQKKPANK